MKNKIFIKLLATFGVVMLLFSIVLGSVFGALFRSHTIKINRTAMEQKAVSIADTLSTFGRGEKGGYGAYLHFLDELAMAEVWIIDGDLNISTRGRGNHAVSYAQLPANAEKMVSQVISGQISYGEEFSGLLGVSAMTVGAPIWFGDRVEGAVLVHSPVSGIDDAVTQSLMTVLAGCAAALLAAGLAAAVLSYRFTKPLHQMKDTALSMVQGDYEVQTGISSHDEIGQLASVLDTLSQRLNAAEAERENLDKMRKGFVANVSHELRTPVAVLRGSLELLQDGSLTNHDEVNEYYSQMLSESRHLERLINDLLELSRLQDAGFLLQMDEVNLCDVLRDAVRAIRRTAQSRQIFVEAALPDTECVIAGDYDRIRQLILILLDNAVKFSYEHGSVEVSLAYQNDLILTITDHGSGIPPDDIPYIFDRFHKSDAKENKSGTGLGLAIASEIAKRHQASISVQSNEMGTSFQIIFQ